MKRNIYLIILLLLIIISCREKQLSVNKFVFFRVFNVVHDSLNNRYLGIIQYFEYNKDCNAKIAHGKIFRPDSFAPPHGLVNFYEFESKKRTTELLNKTFCNVNYDSTYNDHFDPRCIYFFYEMSNLERKLITFGNGNSIPPDLLYLFHYIEDSCISHGKLVSIKPFRVDNIVPDYEKELFLKHPHAPMEK